MSAATLPPPDETGRRAIAWAERRDREDWSEQDQTELNAWLAESTANMVAYLRVADAWSRADRLGALRRPMKSATRRAVLPAFVKIAAVVAIAAGIGAIYAPNLFAPRDQIYATPVGGTKTIKLADGSQIEMNTDTVLRVGGDQRSARLEKGEAYFRIRHDAARPFVVTTGHHRVTDLGTAFLVQNVSNRIEVALVEGRASFDAQDGRMRGRAIDMTPGNVITATNNSVNVARETVQELQNKLAWQKGMLVFDRVTLEDAAAQFNRYNTQKLVIADPSAAKRKIGGTFPAKNTELFARAAKNLLGLRVQASESEIVISR